MSTSDLYQKIANLEGQIVYLNNELEAHKERIKTYEDNKSRQLFDNNQITDHDYWRRYWEGQALSILAREPLEEDMRDNLDKIIKYAHELAKGLEKLEFPDK